MWSGQISNSPGQDKSRPDKLVLHLDTNKYKTNIVSRTTMIVPVSVHERYLKNMSKIGL